jgi:hypothetical protein
MVQHRWVLFIFLAFSAHLQAQDERYYRHLLMGDLPLLGKEIMEPMEHQFNVQGTSYRFDLDGDGIEETIQPQKRDGVDWLEIRNSSERKIFESKLLAMGADSSIYKLRLVNLSPKVKTLIIFLDEGHTVGRKFESTARVFLLSFENNDFSTFALTSGPHFFHEKESQREQYFRRDYNLNVYDINNDGIRDIAFQYNHIQRIFSYLGRGEWSRY